MPSVIDEWLANPKCHTYGVETDGRIVAVGNLRLVDRGKTGWMEGLRVHPEYRKKGYADMLTQHFLSIGETLKVKQLRYSTGGNNRASLKLAKKAGFKRLFKMSAFWYDKLDENAKTSRTRTAITEITLSEAKDIFEANPNLIPHGILVYDWKAVDATLLGFREIGKDHTFYANKKTDRLQSFSFGHTRKEVEGGRWSFTIYAPNQNRFLAHFKHHTNTALSMNLNATVCTGQTQFEIILKELKVPKLRWKMQLILLEKQVKQNTRP